METLQTKNEHWNWWQTSLLFLGLFLAFIIFQTIGTLVGMFKYDIPLSQIESLGEHGNILSYAAVFGGVLGTIAVIIFALIKKNSSFKNYFDFHFPSLKSVLIWFSILILYIFGMEVLSQNFEYFQSDFAIKVYQNTTNYLMLFLGVGVFAPVFEEFLFRGFIYRGLVPTIGLHRTIWSTSTIFGIIHLQYDFGVVLLVILSGALLGYARHYSKSLILPILMHCFFNTANLLMIRYFT